MSKSNLAVKEELNDVVGEEAILQETTINNINIMKKEKTNKKVLYKFTKRKKHYILLHLLSQSNR